MKIQTACYIYLLCIETGNIHLIESEGEYENTDTEYPPYQLEDPQDRKVFKMYKADIDKLITEMYLLGFTYAFGAHLKAAKNHQQEIESIKWKMIHKDLKQRRKLALGGLNSEFIIDELPLSYNIFAP